MPAAKKWQKITLRTIPVYLLAVVLIVFARPSIPLFFIGLTLILLGEGVRIWAAGHLQKNAAVTTTGPYAHLKNPLYFGTFWIMVGFCLMARNYILLFVGLAVFLVYYAPYKKRREGRRLMGRFGEAWTKYDRSVPDYIPRLSPYEQRGERRWQRGLFLKNDEQGTALSVLIGIALMALRFWL